MDEPKTIREDDRPILELVFPGVEGAIYRVGTFGLTRIVPYSENGQMEAVPWFALYQGDTLQTRVNAAHVESVRYTS